MLGGSFNGKHGSATPEYSVKRLKFQTDVFETLFKIKKDLNLTYDDIKDMDNIALIDPELNRAYKLYNRYLHFNKATYKDLDKIRKDLYMFFQEFRLAKSEELQ